MMADQRTMAQLLQEPTEGYEDEIVVPAITADNFELKHGLLTLVQNKQLFGHEKEDPHAHIRYFNKITSTLKFPNVPNTSIKLMLFPFSLEGAARIWLEKEPPRSVFTWDDLVSKFINQFFPPSKITNLRNEITNFQLRFDESFSEAWDRFKDFLRAHQDSLNSAAGGNFFDKMPRECLAIIESKSKVRYSHNNPVVAKVSTNTSTFGISPDVAELKDMVKALLLDKKTTDGNVYHDNIQEFASQASAVNYNQGNTSYRPPMVSNQIRPPAYQAPAYQAPAPQTQGVSKEDFSSYVKANDAVMRNMQTQGQDMQKKLTYLTDLITKDVNTNNASTLSSGTLPSNTIANLRSDLKAITTRSEATKDTMHLTNNGSTEDVQPQFVQSNPPILTSDPVNSLIIEPVISPVSTPRPSLRPSIPYPSRMQDQKLSDKVNDQHEKFFQIFKDLNFNISFADALIVMPKKSECLALADLGASINLMSLPVWNKLFLPDLNPTCMTLELADRSISHPVRVAEDVYVKVGSFHFPVDFVVVDFDADPRVPLILGRSFLKTGRALIDVFEGELTLRVGKEAITFNLDQTSRYSANYSKMTAKRIDVIDMAFKEYFDFLLEEVDAFLAIEDDPTSLEVDQSYLDPEGDIILLEAFLNDDPSLPPPNQGNYLPEVRKELKICEAKSDKSSIDEPPEVELKDLPPHLEYAFLESDDKLPVIIVKDLSVEEKTALITILKSHKRAIAWKLSDIKGIDPEFCTHKILMEEDSEPAVQHQRRVNPKIHDVIKQEVLKLLNAGLIYPIFDSPWNSFLASIRFYKPPPRWETTWRVCIDYRKLNEATRKDHFPLPFMDQMLERLAGNQYYCFLDGFSGYFQILIDPKDQEKTTFTCPYRMFAYRRMHFGLCNAPGTFQRCMMAIFYDMIEKTMEVFMDDISVFGNSFQSCLSHLERMLKRPMTRLLEKDTPIHFSKECVEAFQTLKRKLTEVPILIAPDWDMPFELMYDASDFAIGAVLGQRQDKHFRPIHYASKTMTEAESNYTTTEKEMLAVVYAFEKFRSYLIMNKSIVYTDNSALKYLFAKKDSKAKLLRWVLLLQEFTFKVIDIKGAENLAADHLSRLENPNQNVLEPKEINESFPFETLNLVSTRGNQSTPWFADFVNYHTGNFVVKGMSSQQKRENHASWSENLNDTLWAFRTAYKTPIGCTPYKLVYGKACHLPIELEHKSYWALKHENFDLKTAGDHRKVIMETRGRKKSVAEPAPPARDPRGVEKIKRLQQRIQELEFRGYSRTHQQKRRKLSLTSGTMGDEEEEYPFVNKYLSFQEEPIVLVEEELCPVYDTNNKEEELMPVYDTDIEDVIEEEEGFVGKEGFGREEDNIEDVVVVANDICS
nr:reverse transcriptase domain-containing protein [Tanacetum cinerariifolium]